MIWKKQEMIELQRSVKKYKLRQPQHDCCSIFRNLWTGKCMLVSCPNNQVNVEPTIINEVFQLLTEADISFCKSNTNLRKVGRKFKNCIRDMQFDQLEKENKIIIYNHEFVAMIGYEKTSKFLKDRCYNEKIEDELMNIKTQNYWEKVPVRNWWLIEIKGDDNTHVPRGHYRYFFKEVQSALKGYTFIPDYTDYPF